MERALQTFSETIYKRIPPSLLQEFCGDHEPVSEITAGTHQYFTLDEQKKGWNHQTGGLHPASCLQKHENLSAQNHEACRDQI